MRAFAALLFLAGLALPQGGGAWPFGPGGAFRKGDFYNLGLIGAKVMDADKAPPPTNMPPRGGRRQVQVEKLPHDDGPDRLRVQVVFPDGPAAKAGIVAGDVIVGVGRRKFSDGSMPAIAKALLKAEAGKGAITLLVQKGGAGAPQKTTVTIPAGGKAAAKPTVGDGRTRIVAGALQWLAKRQQDDGSYRETLSGPNGAVVQGSLAGLAWLGAGHDLSRGEYKENLRRLADWIGKAVRSLGESRTMGRGGANWNQCNWGLAYAAMFLGELQARSPDAGVKEALFFCAGELVKNQEESGGWAHGPGGPNALGYVELNIVTGLALSGLGVARQAGFEVPAECLAKAEEYLKASSGGDGGVGYSDKPGQKGAGNIGRSAGNWIGYLALGRGKSAWGKKMGAYVRRHAGEVLGGHASLMQHIQLAGMAAHAQGGAARKDFWKRCERDLVLARAPDGSLQPRPWHESLSMGSNSDVSTGEVWTTASWACVLVAEVSKDKRRGFPALFGQTK